MSKQGALISWEGNVLPEWVDYNGHLRDAFYLLIFSYATDGLMDHIGLDAEGRRQSGHTLFTLETHLNYLKEVKEGRAVQTRSWVLEMDAKRVRVYHELYPEDGGDLLAANEQLLVNVDISGPRTVAFGPSVEVSLQALLRRSPGEAQLSYTGRKIALSNRMK